MNKNDCTRQVDVNGKSLTIYDISQLEVLGTGGVSRLPFSIRVLVENLLRRLDGHVVSESDVRKIAGWQKHYHTPVEIPFHPERVLMQDFTGVPAVVDLAAMRDAVHRLGGDPTVINPQVPVDLVIDHSVQVDYFGTAESLQQNAEKEYERNSERYRLLKWAQKNFDGFRVVPPCSGICHQVNLEYLGQTVTTRDQEGSLFAFPDTLVGTDSHTTMINGIGVAGWGVGGIEAEAVMLGQPYYMPIPEVIGVRLIGEPGPGVTSTDIVLHVTKILREYNVVDKFVEFFGPGMKMLSVPDRATVANMAPEYGATMGFFPVDDQTVAYFKMTNRSDRAAIIEQCARAMHLYDTGKSNPEYSDVVEINLALVKPSVAGPARPQDRIFLNELKDTFAHIIGCDYQCDTDVCELSTFFDESGSETIKKRQCIPVNQRHFDIEVDGRQEVFGDGSVVIAAITSCTNTSNPAVMLGAALLARNAVKRGLKTPAFVKTSLAPGSKVVTEYLKHSGLMPYLEQLGFYLTAYGCTTCIGNSGPLVPEADRLIEAHDLHVAAVLSGNRNFEARIHQNVQSNFLASPMLVIAFGLAGRIDIDLKEEPVGFDQEGTPVFLHELWPRDQEIRAYVEQHVKSSFFDDSYRHIFEGDMFWDNLESCESATFTWDDQSTYIREAPYFFNMSPDPGKPSNIHNARVLLMLGDTVTTDHISPAGSIPVDYPAGQYLVSRLVEATGFNSYGSRRGNHEVMLRGTFGNIRLKNRLVDPKEGSLTIKYPEKTEMYVHDAAMEYRKEGTPLIVIGGLEYGTGSSRDWAAKGSLLLGVKAIIARSFERIHRSNLVGMGILPLVFMNDEHSETLGLDGTEVFSIAGVDTLSPRKVLTVTAEKEGGFSIEFKVLARLDTDIEVEYYTHGGILPYVLRKLTASGR